MTTAKLCSVVMTRLENNREGKKEMKFKKGTYEMYLRNTNQCNNKLIT
jgi:hypothetical protein